MRAPFTCEDEFQDWAVRQLGRVGHIQPHNYSHYPGVPDVSAAVGGTDFWLECKYGVFDMAAGRQKRDYERFKFKETTRLQLDWLISRAKAGRAQCGILGYFNVKPTLLTPYVFYMDADIYLSRVQLAEMNVGAAVLNNNSIAFHELDGDPSLLVNFLLSRKGSDGRHGSRHGQG